MEARAAAAHVFVDDIEAPALAAEDHHHLARVLRLRPGELVSVADGRGAWRRCRLDGVVLEPAGPVVGVARPAPEVTVALAVPKGDRADWAVQKLTEVGVDRIVPLLTERAVVRWDDEGSKRHVARWRAIARQAAMQSRRARIPDVADTALPAAMAGDGVALADPDGRPPSLAHPTVLVGPEGGWSTAELALELPRVGLGAGILRTETAAVVAGTLLVALRRGLVAPDRGSPYRAVRPH